MVASPSTLGNPVDGLNLYYITASPDAKPVSAYLAVQVAIGKAKVAKSVKHFLRGILDCVNRATLETWAGIRKIAFRAGMSERGARYAMKQLVEAGAVVKAGRTRANGATSSSLLTLIPGSLLRFLGADELAGGPCKNDTGILSVPVDQAQEETEGTPPTPPFRGEDTPEPDDVVDGPAPKAGAFAAKWDALRGIVAGSRQKQAPMSTHDDDTSTEDESMSKPARRTEETRPLLFEPRQTPPTPCSAAPPSPCEPSTSPADGSVVHVDFAGQAGEEEDSGPFPAWLPRPNKKEAWTRDHMLGMVGRCIEAVKGKATVARTTASPVVGLWKWLGRPALAEFERDFILVAEWAKDSTDRLAARDIRAENWPDGEDRSRSTDTLCRRDKWGDRLEAAERWDARGRTDIAPKQEERTSAPSPTAPNIADRAWRWVLDKASSPASVGIGETDNQRKAIAIVKQMGGFYQLGQSTSFDQHALRRDFIARWNGGVCNDSDF